MFVIFQLLRKLSFVNDPATDCSSRHKQPRQKKTTPQQCTDQCQPKNNQHTSKQTASQYFPMEVSTETSSSNFEDEPWPSANYHRHRRGQRISDQQQHQKQRSVCCEGVHHIRHDSTDYDENPTSDGEDNVVFTDNRIYCGINENNINNMSNNNKVGKKRSFRTSATNYYHENLINDNNNRHQGNEQKCSRKLNFYESNRNHQATNVAEITFEKVNFDKNKKYMQTSPIPSTSSGNSSLLLEKYLSNSPLPHVLDQHHHQHHHIPASLQYDEDDANGNFQAASDSNYRLHEQTRNFQSWLDHKKQYTLYPKMLFDDCCNKDIINDPEIHYENISCSRRTSISTTETWIDDEMYDNSFNEELEKRCLAVFQR